MMIYHSNTLPYPQIPNIMMYEFHLPDVDFGLADESTIVKFVIDGHHAKAEERDTIKFRIAGINWHLRKTYYLGDKAAPADVILNYLVSDGSSRGMRKFSGNCILQVDEQLISKSAATSTAGGICWILQLALGKKISWDQFGKRTLEKYELIQKVRIDSSTQQRGQMLLSNYADGVIKTYLEAAYPIYAINAEWWRVTLDWIAIASQSGDIEQVGLICSMLLDRISSLVLKDHKFPKQIDENLSQKLEPQTEDWKFLKQETDVLLGKLTSSWKPERSEALIKIIRSWNDEPSYPKKIQAVFAKIGLPTPNGKLLQNRHKLAHEGRLASDVDPVQYYKEITELVLTLLLKMLNYSGKYFVLGVGERSL